MTKKEANCTINSGRFDELYPIILGKFEKEDNNFEICDSTKSKYLNSEDNKKIVITKIEKNVCEYVKDDLNTHEIICLISQKNNMDFNKCKDIILSFYKKLLGKNSILFYKKSESLDS